MSRVDEASARAQADMARNCATDPRCIVTRDANLGNGGGAWVVEVPDHIRIGTYITYPYCRFAVTKPGRYAIYCIDPKRNGTGDFGIIETDKLFEQPGLYRIAIVEVKIDGGRISTEETARTVMDATKPFPTIATYDRTKPFPTNDMIRQQALEDQVRELRVTNHSLRNELQRCNADCAKLRADNDYLNGIARR